MQKYTAMAVTVGTSPERSAPAKFVMSPTNQTERKRRLMPSAEPCL
jgi:hypothetical protein